MRRETPQNILFPANLSEVQTIRVEILEATKPPFTHQFFKLEECWVILQQMSDHQPAVEMLRHAHELFGLAQRKRKRLFDEHVLARFQRSFGDLVMLDGGRCDRNGGDRCITSAPHRSAATLPPCSAQSACAVDRFSSTTAASALSAAKLRTMFLPQ